MNDAENQEDRGDCASRTGALLAAGAAPGASQEAVSAHPGDGPTIATERVLLAMAEVGESYLSFRHTSERSAVPLDAVRPIVRDLATWGFAEFGRGLWTEDGEMYGSGYRLTEAGRAFASALEARRGETPLGGSTAAGSDIAAARSAETPTLPRPNSGGQ